MISTLDGKIASNQIIRHVPIKLGSKTIKTDLILLALEGMDIILGMNWMALHGVTLDISSRAVEINSPSHGATTLYLLSRECINSYAFTMEGVKLEDIQVVCEFADVFWMTCQQCHRIGTLSSLSNCSQALHLSPKYPIECHPRSWPNLNYNCRNF
jgi:hypothetical protein